MDAKALLEIFLTSGITQMAKSAVDNFILYLKNNNYKFGDEKTETILREYLNKSYENNAKMNTIVFRGEQKTVFDLYIPLTLVKRSGENKEEILIDEHAVKCIEKYKRIMIVDSAGMGKSTLAKYISVQSVLHDSYIPIIIELRKIINKKTIWSYLCELFDMIDQSLEYNEIRGIIKNGGFLIIFDGYDEIAEDLRADIVDQISEFTGKATENLYILTSREEEELSSFGDFCEFKIKPLSLNEAFDLINKYGNNGQRAKRLIDVIKQERKNFSVLNEFLVNPLLVSLLYRTFEYKEELPYKKTEFYRQVYEALFNEHDKSKEAYVRPKKCRLAIREFESVLRYLAFFSMQKWCVEYESIQKLLKDVAEAIGNVAGIGNVKPEDFVHDLLHSVPLFQKDGGAYRWAHKSFMEYFAAQCIYLEMDGNAKESLLTQMTGSERGAKYYNILDFYYDMDMRSVRKYVIKPFLENFLGVLEKVKEKLNQLNLSVSDEMKDMVASLSFFLNYKIIFIEKNIREKEKQIENEDRIITELFDWAGQKYGKGYMVISQEPSYILWHSNTRQNIYLPKLLNEKYISLIWKNSFMHLSSEDKEWVAQLETQYEYIDDICELLRIGMDDLKIKKLFEIFFYSRNRIYCLCGEKCRLELNIINEEVQREDEMCNDRFLRLEY